MVSVASGLTPTKASVAPGASVNWLFAGPGPHAIGINDTSGNALFGSGARPPGGTWAFVFAAAGTYPITDAAAPGSGSVAVSMVAKPTKGVVTTGFAITWASAAPPAGFVEDVQIKRPGTTRFTAWKTGVTVASGTFAPDAGAGSYSFRTELRNTGNGAHSGYSPNLTIKVT